MTKGQSFDEYFAIAQRLGGYCGKKVRLKFYLHYLFQDMSFDGRSMLDIGGGFGLFSLYGACMGAKPVICLEPELAGSSQGAQHKLRQLCDSLPAQINITAKPVTFEQFEPGNQTFDIILLHNTINHLDEEACINLRHSDAARKRYYTIFQKLSELAAPGGKLIIADCSRHNFWHQINLRSPLAPTIEWHKHQSPDYWSRLLRGFGFVNPQIRWLSPSIAPTSIGKLLAYLTTSHFCLVMDKL